jgi:hypothetical protein
MDVGEPRGLVDPSAPLLAIEAMLGYTESIGTALWYEIGKDHGKVGQKRPRIFPFFQGIFWTKYTKLQTICTFGRLHCGSPTLT